MNGVSIMRGVKFATVIIAALAIAGCAKNQADQTGAMGSSNMMGSAAAPGSQQDFVVNVGDRVFFDTDSTDLSQQARSERSTSRRSGSRHYEQLCLHYRRAARR